MLNVTSNEKILKNFLKKETETGAYSYSSGIKNTC